jgi:hypothetical protein
MSQHFGYALPRLLGAALDHLVQIGLPSGYFLHFLLLCYCLAGAIARLGRRGRGDRHHLSCIFCSAFREQARPTARTTIRHTYLMSCCPTANNVTTLLCCELFLAIGSLPRCSYDRRSVQIIMLSTPMPMVAMFGQRGLNTSVLIYAVRALHNANWHANALDRGWCFHVTWSLPAILARS